MTNFSDYIPTIVMLSILPISLYAFYRGKHILRILEIKADNSKNNEDTERYIEQANIIQMYFAVLGLLNFANFLELMGVDHLYMWYFYDILTVIMFLKVAYSFKNK